MIANIGADKIRQVFEDYLRERDEPLFLFLEIPSRLNDALEEDREEPFYSDIYYLDGMGKDECIGLLHEFGDLLFEDGMLQFGFGGHFSHEEIAWEKYNVFTYTSSSPRKIASILKKHEIPEDVHLITAWETFSKAHYGVSEALDREVTIYDLPQLLASRGLYFAERRKNP